MAAEAWWNRFAKPNLLLAGILALAVSAPVRAEDETPAKAPETTGLQPTPNDEAQEVETAARDAALREFRTQLKKGRLDEALDTLTSLPESPQRDAAIGLLASSPTYQERTRRQKDALKQAMDAARAGRIDLARARQAAGARIRTVTPPEQAAVDQALTGLVPPDIAHPEFAESYIMSLAQFAPAWVAASSGTTDLDFELAETGKAIERESVCNENLDPFEKVDCSKYQVRLRAAIKEGFRRRFIIAHPSVHAEYVIGSARWNISVPINGFGDQLFGTASPFQLATPGVCQDDYGGTKLCREERRYERFNISMSAPDARPIAKTFGDTFKTTVAAEIVRDGAHRLWSSGNSLQRPQGYSRWFAVYRIVGVLVEDGSGRAVYTSGIYK